MYRADDEDWSAPAGGAVTLRTLSLGRLDGAPERRRFPLVVDLGADIGSARWLRGMATLCAMIAALLRIASPPTRPMVAPAAPPHRAVEARPRLVVPLPPPATPSIDIALTLRSGERLRALLVRAGATRVDAQAAATLLRGDLPRPAAGLPVAVTLGAASAGGVRPLDRIALHARLDLALVVRRGGDGLVLDRQAIAIDHAPRRFAAAIGTSLYRAARDAGVPLPVLAEYLRTIARRIDIGAVARGDRIELAMANARAATGESQPGRLLYAGLTHDGRPLQMMRWTFAGHEGWFDGDGAGDRHDGFALPVAGRLTSGFGMRFHPILGYSRLHQGVDLAAADGTPIVAASAGVVRFAGWHGGHGNYVLIAHAGGMATGYGHMSGFVVAPGQSVRQGELIGYVGSTGLSTGPHCHFETFRDGVAIDPATATFSSVDQLAGDELLRFRVALARLIALPTR